MIMDYEFSQDLNEWMMYSSLIVYLFDAAEK